ncbi:MAG: PAS domain S-box protein, partial [Candidatus Coatesbacteria bacterium]|nr:PAS domain S-box protein [Candidatus Coatesbacteria bacterium]
MKGATMLSTLPVFRALSISVSIALLALGLILQVPEPRGAASTDTLVSHRPVQGERNHHSTAVGILPLALFISAIRPKRSASDGRSEHSISISRLIRDFRKHIEQAEDCEAAIRRACDFMTRNTASDLAWIALADEAGKMLSVASSGSFEHFDDFSEMLGRGVYPPCATTISDRNCASMAIEDTGAECRECPLASNAANHIVHVARVENRDRAPGLMCAYTTADEASETGDGELLEGLADSLALVLNRIGLADEIAATRQQLSESEREYRELFTSSINGIALCEIVVDEAGNPSDYIFLEVNDAFEELTGLKAEDAIGKRITELLPKIRSSAFIGTYGRVALTGEPARFEMYSEDLKRNYDISAYSPRQGQFVAVFTDLARLSNVVEQIGEGIATIDLNGNLTFVNSAFARMHGFEPVELIGKGLDTFHNERQMKDEVVPFIEATKLQGSHYGEVGHIRRDGTSFPTEMTTTLFRDMNGRPLGISGSMIDITERKQAEEERAAQVRLMKCLDEINTAIHGAIDMEQMLWEIAKSMLSIFDCDRAWLLYPCDPDAPTYRVLVEVTRPSFPGAFELNEDLPMKGGTDLMIRKALDMDGPVAFGPGGDIPLTGGLAEQFDIKSILAAAAYPKTGKPWALGL